MCKQVTNRPNGTNPKGNEGLVMEMETGTNPESFTSAESVVEAMLARVDEPEQEESTEETGTQTDDSTAAENKDDASAEAEKAEPVKATEEISKFELPKQQSAEYSKDVMAHYAKRYGTTFEEAEKNPALRSAIKQAIDKDIYIEQLKSKEAAVEVPKVETKTEPAKTESAATPTVDEYLKQIETETAKISTPEMEKRFEAEIWKAFAGVDINDPEVAKQLKDRGIETSAAVKTLTTFGYNLARAAAQQAVEAERANMAARIEENFPGFQGMHQSSLFGNAWEGVLASNEAYKGLPEYGTKEFRDGVDQVLKDNPWVNEMVIPGATVQDLIAKKYEVAARIMSGHAAVKPADLAQAADKGKQQGAEAARTVARSKLDSGRTRGTISAGKDSGGQSDIVAAWTGRHASL